MIFYTDYIMKFRLKNCSDNYVQYIACINQYDYLFFISNALKRPRLTGFKSSQSSEHFCIQLVSIF